MTDRICSIEGCNNVHASRGWCGTHYSRWKKHGDPLIHGSRIIGDDLARFWSHVDQRDPDGCWPWTGTPDKDGYGLIRVDGRTWRATRWIFGQVNDEPLAPDEMARHTCDNPPCVRPDHLLRGTALENSADQVERDRSLRGERHNMARLNADAVRGIRIRHARGETQRAIAAGLDVSEATVWLIVHGKTWIHVV